MSFFGQLNFSSANEDGASELAALQAAGYRVEVDEAETANLVAPRHIDPDDTDSIPGYPCYRTVEENDATLAQLAEDYPTLATLTEIGDSWDKAMAGGSPGYDIWRLNITNQVITRLNEQYLFYTWAKMDGQNSAVRLVTSWATPGSAVDEFLSDLKSL